MTAHPAPVDPGSGGLVLWAMSGIGTATLVTAIITGTALAACALAWFRPQTPDATALAGQIRPVVLARRSLLSECAAGLPEGLRHQKPLTYVYFYVANDGRPSNPIIEASPIDDPAFRSCVTRTIRNMTFDTPNTPVRVPLVLD